MARDNLEDRVKRHFLRVYEKHLINESIEVPLSRLSKAEQADYHKRQQELHPSSFPVCPLRMAYEKLILASIDDPVVYRTFGSDYYLNLGTVVHQLIQRWLGRSGHIVGNWSCMNCKAGYRFCVKPTSCRKCRHDDFNYHELGGKDDNVAWHTDSVYSIGDYLWVVDYKTTSEYYLDKHRKHLNGDRSEPEPIYPYKTNVFQIEGYVPLIESRYNCRIEGWIIPYIGRGKPNSMYGVNVEVKRFTDAHREKIEDRLDRFKKAHKLAQQVLLYPKEVLKKAMATKICESRSMYDEQVREFFNPCPLEDVCFNKKHLLEALKEVI